MNNPIGAMNPTNATVETARIVAVVAILLAPAVALAKDQSSAPPPPANGATPEAAVAPAPEAEGAELAKKLNNPISDLVSVPFQFNWENGIGNPDQTRFILNVQPVMPFTLNEKWNLIARIVAPLISQVPIFTNGVGTSGIGDPLVSFFLSPAEGSITWGVGPALGLPSTHDPTLGSEKWAAGPTFVVLKQRAGWTVGALANQIWSFAGNPARSAVNQMFLQPFVAYTTKDLWTIAVNSETTANWEVDSPNRWNVPVNFMVSKLSTFGTFPASYQFGWGYFFAQPDSIGPAGEHSFGATWKVRGTITILLPKKKP